MTTQDIIDELDEQYNYHRVREFIERHPKFLPHEVKEILLMVYGYGFEKGEEEERDRE